MKYPMMVFFTILSLLSASQNGRAAYTLYSSQSSFLAASVGAGLTVSTENFDELPNLSTYPSPVLLNGVTYTTFGAPSSPSSYEAVGGSFWPSESNPQVFVLVNGFTPAILAFGGGNVGAFGLALSAPVSVSASNPLIYSIDVFEANGTFSIQMVSFTSPGLSYLGFVENNGAPGISEIGIVANGGAIALDDVSHSTIRPGNFVVVNPLGAPEPASILAFSLGIGTVWLVRGRLIKA